MNNGEAPREISALTFTQWLTHWDGFEYSNKPPTRKPKPHNFLFTMNAAELRSYSDVYKRERTADDVEGIQRVRDDKRTDRIQRFVQHGYPYGDLKESQRTDDKDSLRKPGWLPTAIVVNILEEGDSRKGKVLSKENAAIVERNKKGCRILLPCMKTVKEGDIRPFEVIDGQHRLWAFDDDLDGTYELPVVAFHGLDIAWQAYLFWSINVSPKRINPSHAFDLYPLLRNQTWLEQTGDLSVYREARAQEITEWLYKHPKSPWLNRINMLGESGAGRVSQAAFVRSLTAAFFGTGRGKMGRYGLFQAGINEDGEPLSWTRAQQIALMLKLWSMISKHIVQSPDAEWISSFIEAERDPFDDKSSLLNQDMGVRAAHAVANDILYEASEDWGLDNWSVDVFDETDTTQEDINLALKSLRKQKFYPHLSNLAKSLTSFDWRSLDGPKVRESRELMLTRRAYRGSGGYTLLTNDLFEVVANAEDAEVSKIASRFFENDE